MEIVDSLITEMDNNEIPINSNLDLPKACNTLTHQTLLIKHIVLYIVVIAPASIYLKITQNQKTVCYL